MFHWTKLLYLLAILAFPLSMNAQSQAACDDGNPCTIDLMDDCGNCFHIRKKCDDGDPNTTDSCDPATGECKSVPFSCDDGNPNTFDYADNEGRCHHVYNVCCDDGNPCTTDRFNPQTGECEFTPIPGCEEPKPCKNVNCDDGNPCTEDYCDPSTGDCVHKPIPGCGECEETVVRPCNDGDPCTADDKETVDKHTGKVCIPCQGTPKECCDTQKLPCDDGNDCTKNDYKVVDKNTGKECEPCKGTPVPNCPSCPSLGSDGCKAEVAALFDGCFKVTVCSGKDLSNVVLDLGPKGFQSFSVDLKYDGLSDYSQMFTSKTPINGVWIKSGCNQSNDCPGCGEYVANPNDCSAKLQVAPGSPIKAFGVYPNPAREEIFLDLGQYEGKRAQVTITDINGRQIYSEKINEVPSNRLRFDLKGTANGVYLMKVQVNDQEPMLEQFVISQ